MRFCYTSVRTSPILERNFSVLKLLPYYPCFCNRYNRPLAGQAGLGQHPLWLVGVLLGVNIIFIFISGFFFHFLGKKSHTTPLYLMLICIAVLHRQQHRPHWLEVTTPNRPAATPGDSHKRKSHHSYFWQSQIPSKEGLITHGSTLQARMAQGCWSFLWVAPWGCLISTNPGAKSLLPPGDLRLLRYSVSGTGTDVFFMKQAALCRGRQRRGVDGGKVSRKAI